MSSQPVMMFQPDQLFASLGKKQLQIESLSEQLNAANRQIASLTKENTELKANVAILTNPPKTGVLVAHVEPPEPPSDKPDGQSAQASS